MTDTSAEELTVYGLLERKLAAEMRLDLAAVTVRRRLETAVALAMRIDTDVRRLRDGEAVDVSRHILDQQALAGLVRETAAPGTSDGLDLTALSDGELNVFEGILAKAMGRPLPDPAEFQREVDARVEAANPQLVADTRALAEIEETRRSAEISGLQAELHEARTRAARLELALENEMKISALLRKKLELVS
jgi:hypothetical protein